MLAPAECDSAKEVVSDDTSQDAGGVSKTAVWRATHPGWAGADCLRQDSEPPCRFQGDPEASAQRRQGRCARARGHENESEELWRAYHMVPNAMQPTLDMANKARQLCRTHGVVVPYQKMSLQPWLDPKWAGMPREYKNITGHTLDKGVLQSLASTAGEDGVIIDTDKLLAASTNKDARTFLNCCPLNMSPFLSCLVAKMILVPRVSSSEIELDLRMRQGAILNKECC